VLHHAVHQRAQQLAVSRLHAGQRGAPTSGSGRARTGRRGGRRRRRRPSPVAATSSSSFSSKQPTKPPTQPALSPPPCLCCILLRAAAARRPYSCSCSCPRQPRQRAAKRPRLCCSIVGLGGRVERALRILAGTQARPGKHVARKAALGGAHGHVGRGWGSGGRGGGGGGSGSRSCALAPELDAAAVHLALHPLAAVDAGFCCLVVFGVVVEGWERTVLSKQRPRRDGLGAPLCLPLLSQLTCRPPRRRRRSPQTRRW
jgi:hypothetical protein